MATPAGGVTVERGHIIAYRIFDIAEELDLARIESDVSVAGEASRLRITRASGQALIVREVPLTLSLGPAAVRLAQERVNADLYARLWSYGVASLQFHMPITPGTAWQSLVERAAAVEDDSDLDQVAQRRVRELAGNLAPAALLPHEPQGMEDYVVYLLETLNGVADIRDLRHQVNIPALILGEPTQQLSAEICRSILDSSLSYSVRDLAVIDWNSALVVDPDGSRDVADMLEFAATHLMEFRYFDTLLDDRLTALYSAVERHHRLRSFFRDDSERLSREASSLYIEFSEHVERVENSLKFVGDFFLATVFRRAAARFQLKEWEDSVMRKVNGLARVSEVLSEETNVRRSHVLEIIIILLIFYEIVHAAFSAAR